MKFDQSGLNVYFGNNLKPYKERKVKILNGSHTALVPVAYLSNIDTVREAMEDQYVGAFVKQYIWNEVIPTIDLEQSEMDKFANAVLERYQNPFVRHELLSIALNSMSKFKSRMLPSILENLENNRFPKLALFSLASLIAFYKGVRSGFKIPLNDEAQFLNLFASLWEEKTPEDVVLNVLSLPHWETTRLKPADVVDYVTKQVKLILTSGMTNALKTVIGAV